MVNGCNTILSRVSVSLSTHARFALLISVSARNSQLDLTGVRQACDVTQVSRHGAL